MNTRQPDYNKDNKMVVRNDYVYAKHPDRMPIQAMRLMRIVITQCRKDDKEFYEYSFRVPDIAEMIGCNVHNLYRDMDDITTMLMQVILITGKMAPGSKGKKFPLFYKCDYDTGLIKMQLHPETEELFLNLNRNFTKIPIAPLLLMKSKYGIRLYEIICQKIMNYLPYAGNSTEVQMTIEEIRIATGTEAQRTYDQIGHLKKKVLEPALKDIERAAEWKIVCTDLKKGRRIIGFNFQVWTAMGYEVIEKCKAEGKLPPGSTPIHFHGDMRLE